MSKDDGAAGFKCWLLICALVLLPALLALGGWQLQRAAQKERLLQAWNDDRVVLNGLESFDQSAVPDVVKARLEGRLLPDRWLLLDNRTRDGRAGYEVIGLLHAEGVLLPVNLGWIVAAADRRILPALELPVEGIFDGRMHRVETGLLLAEDTWDDGWPKRVQALDSQRLSQALGQAVLPWVLDVTVPVVTGLRIDRPQASLRPERHLGYAFQWFTMAAALAGLLLWHWRRLRAGGVTADA